MLSLSKFLGFSTKFSSINFNLFENEIKNFSNSIIFNEATKISGKKVAKQMRKRIKKEIEILKNKHNKSPGLAVILVGDRIDSQTYVKFKEKAAQELGINSFSSKLPASISEEKLLEKVIEYNNDPNVNGILVQLPLPKHINEKKILDAISISKDVDGFHPQNIGDLCMKGRTPKFIPCTPNGAMDLLDSIGLEIEGKHAVVVGRSNIVGLPAAMLLLHRNATVTIVHSKTKDIQDIVKQADIIIAAVGRKWFVKKDWIKPGAVVIDVGINKHEDPSKKAGYRITGDVEETAKEVAGAITPVPGGCGPMTIVKLMENTFKGFKDQNGIKE